MPGFALRLLRHRKASFVGTFIALLCASALVCACGMLLETGLRGAVEPERYAGTPVIVAADQSVTEIQQKSGDKTKEKSKPISELAWLPASVAEELRQENDASNVVTEVTFPSWVEGDEYLGHGWESAELTPFTIADGQAPDTEGEVVVDADADLEVGATTSIQTPEGTADYLVTGVTAEALPSQRTLFFNTEEAQRLSGRPDQFSAIGVFAEMGQAPDGTIAYRDGDRGTIEFQDAEQSRVQLVSLGGALGGTSLLVAILVVVGTFALSIQQRRQEIALLRAVAATPRQMHRLLRVEALAVSLLGGTLGAAGGIGLGHWLYAQFVDLGAMPTNLPLVVSPLPPIAALAATVLAAWAATLIAARRAAQIRPVEALSEAALGDSGPPWIRSILGIVFVAGGIVLTLVLSNLNNEAASSPVMMLTPLVWTIAAALLAPLIAKVAVAILGIPLRLSPISGFLARRNLRTRTPRLASVITPLCLMVAMTSTILFSQTTLQSAAQDQADAGVQADYVLGPRVSSSVADDVRDISGVEAVTEVLHTSVRVGLERYGAQAVTAETFPATMDLGIVSGSVDTFDEESIALSETAAGRLDATVGDAIELFLGDGTPVELVVTATYERGLGFADLTLPHSLVRNHVDNPLGTALVAAPSVSGDALTQATPEVTALSHAEAPDVQQANPEVNFVAMGLIVAFTAIAVVNTLAMSTSTRGAEFTQLRLVGTTRRQILRVLRIETLMAALVGLTLGSGIAFITLSGFSTGMTGSATLSIPPTTYMAVLAAAAGLALLATTVPARFTIRTSDPAGNSGTG